MKSFSTTLKSLLRKSENDRIAPGRIVEINNQTRKDNKSNDTNTKIHRPTDNRDRDHRRFHCQSRPLIFFQVHMMI